MISETVYKYCCEDISRIENYSKAIADETQTWDCHHRAEILPCGIYSIYDLIKYDLYLNQPAERLIFLTKAEHQSIHQKNRSVKSKAKFRKSMTGRTTWMKGRKLTAEERKIISERTKEAMKKVPREKLSHSRRGKDNPNYGRHPSDETRRKISAALLGRKQSEETKRKRAEKLRGRKHTEESKRLMSEHSKGKNLGRVPWNKGRKQSEETKAKISESLKGNNNRIKNKTALY